MTQSYGEASYWDDRYKKETGSFDWYQKYEALAPLLSLYLRPSHRVLVVGCGNSVFGEDMVNDGYVDIVNVDISSVVIESMQKKYCNRPQLKFMKMDVKEMVEFENHSFDAVIDKGTLDSIMCGHESQENAKMMLDEIARVLKKKGVYIMVTYGDPSYRLYLLREINSWKINVHVIDRFEKKEDTRSWDITKPLPLTENNTSVSQFLGPKPDVHYIYVCTKDEDEA